MLKEDEIRKWLLDYLNEDVTLEAFENWLASASWNMHLNAPQPAQDLAAAIELRLFEYSAKDLSETELRSRLLDIAETTESAVVLTNNAVITLRRAGGFVASYRDLFSAASIRV